APGDPAEYDRGGTAGLARLRGGGGSGHIHSGRKPGRAGGQDRQNPAHRQPRLEADVSWLNRGSELQLRFDWRRPLMTTNTTPIILRGYMNCPRPQSP